MNILLACDNSSILNTILFIKHLINIIFIVAPIVLVLLLTIDIAKNVISKDDDENKRNVNIAIKRVVYCLALFFVPVIIDGVMSYLDNYNVNFATCYEKATEENVQKYFDEETKRDEEKQAEKEKEREENKNKIQDEQNSEAEAIKKSIEDAGKKVKEIADNAVNSVPSDIQSVTKYTKSNGMISHATSVAGRKGRKGDQSGKEVVITDNTFKWSYIARFKDPKKAEMLARCAEAGAKNNKIGYGVNEYGSLYREAKKVNWDLSKITTKCNTVCSAFAAVCINAAGTPITKDLNGYSTSVKTHLKNTGDFNFYDYKKSKTMRGDVLVITRRHVGMAL